MPEVYSISRESHQGPHSLMFMSGHLSNCAWRCRTKARFISQDYPGPKAWYPLSTGLPCFAYKVRLDPIRTCLSFFRMVLRTYAHIKSSSGEERQIWEYLEWISALVLEESPLHLLCNPRSRYRGEKYTPLSFCIKVTHYPWRDPSVFCLSRGKSP